MVKAKFQTLSSVYRMFCVISKARFRIDFSTKLVWPKLTRQYMPVATIMLLAPGLMFQALQLLDPQKICSFLAFSSYF